MPRKPSDEPDSPQQPLPFVAAEMTRGEEMNLLCLALSRAACDLYLAQFMFWLYNTTDGGRKGMLRKSYEQLAARPRGLCCSVGKARATVREARRLALCRIQESSTAAGAQGPNDYTFDLSLIRTFLRLPPVTEKQGGGLEKQGDVTTAQGPVTTAQAHIRNNTFSHLLAPFPTPPPQAPAGESAPADLAAIAAEEGDGSFGEQGGEALTRSATGLVLTYTRPVRPAPAASQAPAWLQAERRLREAGLRATNAAAQQARQRGLSPDQLVGLVEFYLTHRRAWECGAIFHAIRQWQTGDRPDDWRLWPTPAKGFVDPRVAAQRAAGQHAAAEAEAEQLLADQARAAGRERQFGSVIDELSPEQLDAVLAVLPEMAAEFVRRKRLERPITGMARDYLLAHFAKQALNPEP